MSGEPYVFVTVGTTSFSKLVREVASSEVREVLMKKGFRRIVLQAGASNVSDLAEHKDGVTIEMYDYKDSIQEDMKHSSIIISHAGAGCIFEALSHKKPLIVVINEDLMDNHQIELAEQLQKDNHLVFGTCRNLTQRLRELDPSLLQVYEAGNPKLFGEYLDTLFSIP